MESNLKAKNSKTVTPVKDSPRISKLTVTPVKDSPRISKLSENLNPNTSHSSPAKSAKSQKYANKNLNPQPNPVVYSPRNKIRERKFVIAKKNTNKGKADLVAAVDCKCGARYGGNSKKCHCVAYESLRASQEEFFKKPTGVENAAVIDVEDDIEKSLQDLENEEGWDDEDPGEVKRSGASVSSTVKRRREKLLEEARSSVPDSGKVMHLVKAFERLLTIPKPKESDENQELETDEETITTTLAKKAMKWELPGMQPPKMLQTDRPISSYTSFTPSELLLTADNLGLDSRASVSSSWDSSFGSFSSRTSNGGRRSRRNSYDSCGTLRGRKWKKKQNQKVTFVKPFKLRTEQRGRMKEEEFMKKMQEMMTEEEKLRVPIAQGLPWTTDEPECLNKPPVKEITRPLDVKLYSDMRAVERADFDNQVAEKLTLIEQYKIERERQQKLAEEEETRRLRKELVPKAQPMPYFDRPFIPRRSEKHPTIPREPKFNIPQHKKIKSCLSWNDASSFTCQQH